MKNLIQYIIRYPIWAKVILLAIFVLGFAGLTGMKTNFFTPIENNLIQITTSYPGASPEEVEKGVILKIENNLKQVSGINKTTSSSSENFGSVSIEIKKGANYSPFFYI